mmetsp:Transcript_87168/g.272913  ORF Transcript_87168/g.272913 Transcript_87168/m.272913 type:complete len:381 (+) Transcript_87168:3-1145(+)
MRARVQAFMQGANRGASPGVVPRRTCRVQDLEPAVAAKAPCLVVVLDAGATAVAHGHVHQAGDRRGGHGLRARGGTVAPELDADGAPFQKTAMGHDDHTVAGRSSFPQCAQATSHNRLRALSAGEGAAEVALQPGIHDLGSPGLHLRCKVALQDPKVDLPQPCVDPALGGGAGGGDDVGRLARAGQVRGDHGVDFVGDAKLLQGFGELARLAAPHVVELDVELALHPLLGVPNGLAVADEEEARGAEPRKLPDHLLFFGRGAPHGRGFNGRAWLRASRGRALARPQGCIASRRLWFRVLTQRQHLAEGWCSGRQTEGGPAEARPGEHSRVPAQGGGSDGLGGVQTALPCPAEKRPGRALHRARRCRVRRRPLQPPIPVEP